MGLDTRNNYLKQPRKGNGQFGSVEAPVLSHSGLIVVAATVCTLILLLSAAGFFGGLYR